MDKARLIVVDDHAVLRDSLVYALEREGGFHIAGSWQDAESALLYVEREPVEVAILDYTLPGIDGIEATREMKRLRPEIKVVLLSMHCGEKEILEAFEAGAMAYLPKEVPMAELIETVGTVLKGRSVLSPRIARDLLAFCTRAEAAGNNHPRPLSQQHIEVLRLAGCGYANKQIGDRLGLSVNTVKLRLKEVFTHLQARDRTHAVVTALKQGLFQLEDTED